MKIFLSIDAGNSNPHVGTFVNGILQSVESISNFFPPQTSFDYSISNVSNFTLPKAIENGTKVLLSKYFKNHSFLEMPVEYESSLGEDRLFQSYYLYKNLLPNESTLLIDAGTFTTIDLITRDGHRGGIILPGINAYFSTFSNGANLPTIIHFEEELKNEALPLSTNDALKMGLKILYKGSIEKAKYFATEKIKMVLTGGQSQRLKKLFKNDFSFQNERDLIHHSLNFCYQQIKAKES